MKVADDKDYDDYNEYADALAHWLADRIELYEQQGVGNSPASYLYSLIQEFNRILE